MAKKDKLTKEDEDLLAELGVEVEAKAVKKYTAREERIIAGFEEIQKFVEEHGRPPQHGEERDIFERLYAVRLDRIRAQKECVELLKDLDTQNLLTAEPASGHSIPDDIDDDTLLQELGVEVKDDSSITRLKHVRSSADKRAVEEMANRTRCEDFDQFKPLFERVQQELDSGIRETIQFRKDSGFTKTDLKKAQFVIVGGQMAYIAEVGESFKAPNGEEDARLRVIYSNGMESNILLRSLIRAMYKDETSRFLTDPKLGGLFSDQSSEDDVATGTIYVLRSQSDHPTIQESRDVIHKIGVTISDVKRRIANAKNEPTFLMADVEVVATYQLANINRFKLEKLIHQFFDHARIDIEIKDRFGKPVRVREWFLVPLFVIDEMVEKVMDGTIGEYYYDVGAARLMQ
ncbi:GIY-YIG nuclease family protein [Phaeodactylibacter sp.]|uniref:GIY-YIG nuclease family protein n=1 Tax=Phaeodactylibacter sp. TaxID=1940289 RepID=UPI0025D22752|nr:GIY-YIG nuclease family protein [Phaeodactylibacter sp.]MCI4648923.1 GIY-YIG nuclease family protein [Phaeodactylibacter sp.]MCI5092657.1 GIY-YIG nuclease family protein [Phaeodactylibacter sp.]